MTGHIKTAVSYILVHLCLGCGNDIEFPDGGYAFSSNIDSRDTNFYYYPLKDIFSTKDSFRHAYDYMRFRQFNEPNLSLKAREEIIFRLEYGGWNIPGVIITMTEGEMIIKKANQYEPFNYDESVLTKIEKRHLSFFEQYAFSERASLNPYLDSMKRSNPLLADLKYYGYLLRKTVSPSKDFAYTTERIPLNSKDYKYLVEQINKSGYWNLPYLVDCNRITDGYGFSLEANTGDKYNYVNVFGCPDDSTRLTKACQAIIKYAKLDKEINLIWEGRIDTVKIED